MAPSIHGTQTEKNLLIPFAGESQARNSYTYFAGKGQRGPEQCPACIHPQAHFELLAGNW